MNRVLDIRAYNLKPGMRAAFHQLMLEQSLPMLQRWQMDVVAFGPSLQADDSYYLIRAFADLADMNQREDAFYGSDEWRQGPREAVLALIENFTSVVIEVDDAALQGMRR